jgi:hypothetical protein
MQVNVAVVVAVVSCLGLSSLGCGRTDKDRPASASPSASASSEGAPGGSARRPTLAAPRTSPTVDEGPGGSTGNNGLDPAVYHASKAQLTVAMQSALLRSPAGTDLGAAFDPLPANEQGRRLVDYTLDCAVKGLFTYKGAALPAANGILSTTAGWIGGPLDGSAQLDVHACLAARLNPTEKPVEIWMGGHHVAGKGAPGGFPVFEALWAAVPGNGGMAIHVWPSPTITASCANVTAEVLSKRVCGEPKAGPLCGLVDRGDVAACTKDAHGSFDCPSAPGSTTMVAVIQTRMRCEDWCTFYSGCAIPAECGTISACSSPAASSPARLPGH